MSIGIIGINKYAEHLNWACPLHCYAFQQYLTKNEIESEVLDFYPSNVLDFDFEHPTNSYAHRMISNLTKLQKLTGLDLPVEQLRECVRNEKPVDSSIVDQISTTDSPENKELIDRIVKNIGLYNGIRELPDERKRRTQKFLDFSNNNIKYTREQYDSTTIEYLDPGKDTYICPTDVVWRLLNGRFERGFFLATPVFDGKNKIAYSVSRGVHSGYTDEEAALLKKYVDDIDFVSVRELDFKEYLDGVLEKKVSLAVDPVFLHNASFWHNVAVKPQEEKYVLLYYVMEKANDTVDMAIEYAKKHKLKIVELSDRPIKGGKAQESRFGEEIEVINRYDIGPDEWLGYIENAEYVFTNSFHACAFSIIFHKTFKAGHRSGTKVQNLIATMGLPENTEFEGEDQIPVKINWDKVDEIVLKKRKESEQFLLNAIEKTNQKKIKPRKKKKKYANRTLELSYCDSGKKDRKKVPDKTFANDGTGKLGRNIFSKEDKYFAGWKIRVRWRNQWLWYTREGLLVPSDELNLELKPAYFREDSILPYFDFSNSHYHKENTLRSVAREIKNYIIKKIIKIEAIPVWY